MGGISLLLLKRGGPGIRVAADGTISAEPGAGGGESLSPVTIAGPGIDIAPDGTVSLGTGIGESTMPILMGGTGIEVTPEGLISTESAPVEPTLALRQDAIDLIWGGTLPADLPAVALNYMGTSYASSFPGETTRVDQLIADLPRGGTSEMHLLHPPFPLNRLAIVHAGHGEHYYTSGPGSTNSAAMVTALLRAGWHVLGVCMPIDGFNQPTNVPPQAFELSGGGTQLVATHDDFAILEADGMGASVLRFFLDGTIIALNYLTTTYSFDRIIMVGISGGGWSTDMVAAFDTRIERSYPVFDSMTFPIRAIVGPSATGDYEQTATGIEPFWDLVVDYDRIYALGALDTGRRRVEYLGDFDPIFTALNVHPELAAVDAWVDARIAGTHEIVIDTTAMTHAYSTETIDAIVLDASDGFGQFDFIESLYNAGIVRRHWAGSLAAGAVSSWPDETGGAAATQGTVAKQPIADLSETFPFVTANNVSGGNAQALEGTLALLAGGSFTAYIVKRAHDATTDHAMLDVSDGNVTNRSFQMLHASGSMAARIAGADAATNNVAPLGWEVWGGLFETTERHLRRASDDTETVNTTDHASIVTDRYRIFALYQDVLPADADFADVILMDRLATAEEQSRIEAELMHAYVL